VVDHSWIRLRSGARSGRIMDRLQRQARSHGPEFVSRDLDLWAYANDVTLDFSRPGKPTDNAFIEAFNGRLRAECLNTQWFLSSKTPVRNWRIGGGIITR
jgi:transposase InsO family protein